MTSRGIAAGPDPDKTANDCDRLLEHKHSEMATMPIRQTDILKDISNRIDPEINPYVAKMTAAMVDGSIPVLQGSALKSRRGNWRQSLDQLHQSRGRVPSQNNNRPLIVEIGCHLGLTLNEMALQHPECDFLGMDITFKRVVTAAERSVTKGLTNIATILGNARGIDAIFADGEVDGFVIFFPDPWLKRSQTKHRLVDHQFTDLLHRKLASGGFAWMKTDQRPYSEAAAAAFETSGFRPVDNIQIFENETYESTFERKFRLQGMPAWESRWVKTTANSRTSSQPQP